MSSQSWSTFQSTSYSSYSDSQGNRYEETSRSDPAGTTTHRVTQEAGKPAIKESSSTPGHRQVTGGIPDDQRRIEDVGDEEDEASKQYKERMEDEYAKKEGGA